MLDRWFVKMSRRAFGRVQDRYVFKGEVAYFISISFMLISFLSSYLFRDNVSLVFEELSIVISAVGFTLFFTCDLNNSAFHCFKLLPSYVILFSFLLLEYMKTDNSNQLIAITGIVCFGSPIIGSFFLLFRLLTNRNNLESILKKTHVMLKKHIKIILLLLVFLFLCIETIDAPIALDADIYYHALNSIKEFDLTFKTLNSLKLGGHMCYGYSIVYGIGYLIMPYSAALLRITNIILVCISTFCLYRILQLLLPTLSDMSRAILCGIFLYNPLILGNIYDINLDLACLSFFIIFLFCHYYKINSLAFFMSFLLLFSKEIGIILLFGFLLPELIIAIVQAMREKNSLLLWNVLKYIVPGIWLGVFILCGMMWRQESIGSNTIGDAIVFMDSIAYCYENIVVKLKELLILNFSWLIWLYIIIASFFFMVKHRKREFGYRIKTMLPILGSMFFFLVFQLLYVTYVHSRYSLPWIMFEVLILATITCLVRKELANVMLAGIAFFLLIESFYTIDPITKIVFDHINIGETEIISTRTFIRGGDNSATLYKDRKPYSNSFMLTQSAQYNRQYMYLGSCFEKALKEINYNEGDEIYIVPMYESAVGMTWICLFGKWYTDKLYVDDFYRLVEYNYPGNHLVSVKIGLPSIEDIGSTSLDKKVFLLSFPYNEAYENAHDIENYNYSDEKAINYRGWRINSYRLK